MESELLRYLIVKLTMFLIIIIVTMIWDGPNTKLLA